MKLAVPATLALLAKAVYNLVNTAYIGMLKDDLAMAGVGVTVPLLLIMVSIENVFAAGAAVLAGRQLGAGDGEGASRTVTTIISQFVTFFILTWFYAGGRSVIKIRLRAFRPAFGLCYMMTITYQTIGASRYGLFLSLIRQGAFLIPVILTLPRFFGVAGIYLTQPAADLLTMLVRLCSVRSMKAAASRNMAAAQGENG